MMTWLFGRELEEYELMKIGYMLGGGLLFLALVAPLLY